MCYKLISGCTDGDACSVILWLFYSVDSQPTSLGIELIRDPVISHADQSADTRGVISVCVLNDGRIVTVGRGFIELRDSNLSVIKSQSIKGWAVCVRRYSASDDCIAVGVRNNPNLVVSVFSLDLVFIRKLVEVKTGDYLTHFDISSSCMAVVSYSDKCLKLFSADGSLPVADIPLTGMSCPKGVCISADEKFVLVSDWGGLVRKYQLTGSRSLVWECQGLSKPTSITEGKQEEFYVSSSDAAEIYVISDKGKS